MGLTTHIYIGAIMLIHDWDHEQGNCIFEISEDEWDESLYVTDLIPRTIPEDLGDAYILIPNSREVGTHICSNYEEAFLDIDGGYGGDSIDEFRETFSKEISFIEENNLGRVEIINRFILYYS